MIVLNEILTYYEQEQTEAVILNLKTSIFRNVLVLPHIKIARSL